MLSADSIDCIDSDLPHAVLAGLAHGQPCAISALAELCQLTPALLRAYLERLIAAGVQFNQCDDQVVQLRYAFEPLHASQIQQVIDRKSSTWNVKVAALLDSSNTRLLELMRDSSGTSPPGQSLPNSILLAAEIQTAGRGQHNRTWHASLGSGLTVSFARRLPRGLMQLSGLSLVCGLAVSATLAAYGIQARLKWPNDVLVKQQKIAGILIETDCQHANLTTVVIGVGINVARSQEFVACLEGSAMGITDINQHLNNNNCQFSRNQLLAELAATLDTYLKDFLDHGFIHFQSAWNDADIWRDLPVQLIDRSVASHGIARGVNEQGYLLIDTTSGQRRIVSTEISIRQFNN